MRKRVNVDDFRKAAKRRLPRIAFDYLDPGAEDEVTCRRNRQVFDRIEWRPRVLRAVQNVDLSQCLFGHEHRMPIVIGPTGFSGLFWPDADLHLARAARDAEIPFVLSTASTMSIEDVAGGAGEPAERWFQLYVLRDRDATATMVRRAQVAGYTALVVTVDTPCAGKRDASLRHGTRLPLRMDAEKFGDFMRHPHWLCQMLRKGQPRLANFPYEQGKPFVMESHLKRELDWSDLEWLRGVWPGTFIIKGIVEVEDALRAVEAGADGIVVSNHGGRQLDGLASPMETLEQIALAVGKRVTVMADSGFRRGSEVLKALALGARAVWLGRATLYGLAAAGPTGARDVLAILRDEMMRSMTLLGRAELSQLDSSAIRWAP